MFGDYIEVIELPLARVHPNPSYPEAARRKGIQGTVLVQALIITNGTVAETIVTKPVEGLNEAAVACVRRWRFQPARSEKGPVAVWAGIPVKFVLR